MRLQKLIKEFQFSEDERLKITLGTDVRLNPERHYLQLAEDSSNQYPTTDDLQAETWITNPLSVKQWLGFDVEALHTKIDGVQVTSLGYKLTDGTTEQYWDGGAWSTAGASDWNTEEEIAGNIDSFPVDERKLGVIINLKTTDGRATPKVKGIKILFSSDVNFQDDILYRSLVPTIRSGVLPRGRVAFEVSASASSFDLDDLRIDTPYNIVDVDSVFNHTDDPNHQADLLDSYNSSTKVVTLTSPISSGKVAWIVFLYEPEVAVTTSQDYTEVEKVPSVILDDVNLVEASYRGQDEVIVNRADGTAVKLPAPLVGDLEMMVRLVTDKGYDLQQLAADFKRYFENNPFLRAVGTDEEYRVWIMDEFDMTTAANRGDIHSARARMRVVDVRYYLRDAIDTYAIKKFHLTGDMNVTVQT